MKLIIIHLGVETKMNRKRTCVVEFNMQIPNFRDELHKFFLRQENMTSFKAES